jgi:hypothetical protein
MGRNTGDAHHHRNPGLKSLFPGRGLSLIVAEQTSRHGEERLEGSRSFEYPGCSGHTGHDVGQIGR